MLAIRLKRTGRANLAQYRVIVQDARRHPKRGAVVEYLGTYDPHAKATVIDKDRIKHYLSNGAQPSTAVAKLLKKDGIKLPKWVVIDKNPKRSTRNPEKLRKNQPNVDKPEAKPAQAPEVAETEKAANQETKAEESPADESKSEETNKEAPAEVKSDEQKTDETASQTPETEDSAEIKDETDNGEDNSKDKSTEEKSEETSEQEASSKESQTA